MTTGPRSTRDRPAKAPLSEGAVVSAALGILRTEGLEAVTMRRVAAALDTGAGSLYVYVAGRDGLLRAMHDEITAAVELETPDPARWREQLHALLERMRDVLVAHPGIAVTAMAEPPTSEASMRLLENLLSTLLAGGIDPQEAAWAADVLAQLVSYAAIEEETRRVDEGQLVAGILQTFAALPPERFPAITAHATELVSGTGERRFAFAVDVLVDGLLARAARTGGQPAPTVAPRGPARRRRER